MMVPLGRSDSAPAIMFLLESDQVMKQSKRVVNTPYSN